MNSTLIIAVYAIWVPLVVALFRVVGPRRAALIAVFGGFLLLPREALTLSIFGTLSINKRVVSGLALLLGVLLFDPRALIRGRPRLVNCRCSRSCSCPWSAWRPTSSSNTSSRSIRSGRTASVGHALSDRPTLLRRPGCAPGSLGRRRGGRRLLYVPICVFEMVPGARYYVLGLVYGIGPHGHMVDRLGGWRPEGFLTNGIELTTWMASGLDHRVWLWLHRGWRPRPPRGRRPGPDAGHGRLPRGLRLCHPRHRVAVSLLSSCSGPGS